MNEGKKTGIFWGAGAVMLGVGALLAYQPSNDGTLVDSEINKPLFEEFKDPLLAASMKIVTFDEEQGTLKTFEVRKDRETGEWTIPSRDGYPADAVEQMRDAANVLVGRKVLDVVMANPADHSGFGVVEPDLEKLNVGDEGVGRLVSFKDQDQKTLASLIIGDPVEKQEGQVYVRKPGQDAVYAVGFDPKPLTTKFQDWIEEDLLKLSSIDIERMEIKDYTTEVNPIQRRIDWVRKFDATVKMDGSQWELEELKEYDPADPFAEPKMVTVTEEQELNTAKLNEIKNALDDVKIADVVRKPEGMSANLKADKSLTEDQKATRSLEQRGFYALPLTPGGELEILSANGELVVGLKDGVEYVLRFGNISGLTEEEDAEETGSEEAKTKAGVNRYLLVTTRVNEAKIPRPELREIPQTLEDLEPKEKPADKPAEETTDKPAEETTDKPAEETTDKPVEEITDKPAEETTDKPVEEITDKPAKESTDKPAEETSDKPAETTDKPAEETDKPAESTNDEPAAETSEQEAEPKSDAKESAPDEPATESGETEASGSGAASGSGQGQNPDDQDADADDPPAEEAQSEDAAAKEPAQDEVKADEPVSQDEPAQDEPPAKDDAPAADVNLNQPANDGQPSEEAEKTEPKVELTEEEKQERLEAEQEKIRKENQRLVDERKDKIDAAKRRVRELNARFADWYYVIPETTYSKLRMERAELFKSAEADDAAAAGPNLNGLNIPPGGGIPGFPTGPTNP